MGAHVHRFVPAGTGEVLAIGPTMTVVKLPGTATEGRLGVVQMHIGADFAGPPPHVHQHVDHLWYVIDGAIDLLLGGNRISARAGDLALVLAGVTHSFSTRGCGPATVLETDVGRALDSYLRELRGALGAGVVDPHTVAEVMRRHDTAVVCPGVPA
jgi:mannose-6-phosphate isomerase-like protein (cupin superfamily)